VLTQFFADKVRAYKGDRMGENFGRHHDPERCWRRSRARRVFAACSPARLMWAGRFSALTYLAWRRLRSSAWDIKALLAGATKMMRACGPEVKAADNPGPRPRRGVGRAVEGRARQADVRHVAGAIELGYWVEQLVAESTGKEGRGILPVEGEAAGENFKYQISNLQRCMGRIASGCICGWPAKMRQDRRIAALEAAGDPVIHIEGQAKERSGQEFFRWEVATAVAGRCWD